MEILVLLVLFQIKHLLCDFVYQNDDQIALKGVYGDLVGMSHSMFHGLATVMVLVWFTSPLMAVGLGLLDGMIHYHVDWVKVRYGVKDITRKRFWNELGLDQMAHQLTYLGLVFFVI